MTSAADAARPLHVGAERAPFVMLPRWLLHHRDISDGAKVLYGMLHDLVAGREGPTRPVTRGQLAGCCGVSIATVDRRLTELVGAGAVEKRAQFETHQGQLANVYWVRLSPPAANLQPPVDDQLEGGNTSEDPPIAVVRPPRLQPWGTGRRAGAAPYEERTQEQELPPQPPRQAGGPEVGRGQFDPRLTPTSAPPPTAADAIRASTGDPSTANREALRASSDVTLVTVPVPRRPSLRPDGEGRNIGQRSRVLGTNPRAEADRAEQARREAEAEARRAELERAADERRLAEQAAALESHRLEAEALAVSAALDDETLAAVVATVRPAMSGPLAGSALAVARAVVAWCRTAAVRFGGDLAAAVAAGLAAGLPAGEAVAPPLALHHAPAGTVPLRRRVGTVVAGRAEKAG